MPGTIRLSALFAGELKKKRKKNSGGTVEKQQPCGIDPGGLVQRRPGLFCCISALPTFTRGARESRGGGARGWRGSVAARLLQGVIFLLWIR